MTAGYVKSGGGARRDKRIAEALEGKKKKKKKKKASKARKDMTRAERIAADVEKTFWGG